MVLKSRYLINIGITLNSYTFNSYKLNGYI